MKKFGPRAGTLSLVLSWLGLLLFRVGPGWAGDWGTCLDPTGFVSLGTFNPSATVVVNLSNGVMGGGATFAGVLHTNRLGTNWVFAFDTFKLNAGITISLVQDGVPSNATYGVVFLARNDMTILGGIHAPGGNGGNGTIGPPGSTTNGGFAGIGGVGPGGDGGRGTPTIDPTDGKGPGRGLGATANQKYGGGGGGFGGAGGAGGQYPGSGGTAYGALTNRLQAGSGGGGGGGTNYVTHTRGGGGGGGGGGMLELGAGGRLIIGGAVNISGGHGGSGAVYSSYAAAGGGGGSGGALLMHAAVLVISNGAVIAAGGGNGGAGHNGGGGGGGGRVLGAYNLASTSSGDIQIYGGTGGGLLVGGVAVGSNGAPGEVVFIQNDAVPTAPGQLRILGVHGGYIFNGDMPGLGRGTDYSHRPVGSSTTHVFTVTNVGFATLSFTAWTTNGAQAADFTILQAPTSLAPGARADLAVAFAPSAVGIRSGTVCIANSSTDTPYLVCLRGLGYVISTNRGPRVGGNSVVLSNGVLGSAGDITNVLVGGAAAVIQAQGDNWVRFELGPGRSNGWCDVVIHSASQGATRFETLYEYLPPGQIGGWRVTNRWDEAAPLPAPRGRIGCSIWRDGLCVAGGFNNVMRTNVYLFDGYTWTEVGGLPTPLAWPGVAALGNELYSAGGDTGTARTNAFCFDGTNWVAINGLPEARTRHGLASVNGSIYAVGGLDAMGLSCSNVYRFDGTNWQETTGLPALRSGLRAVAHSNRLLAIGGYYGGYRTNVYALDGGGWVETAGLPEGLERFGAAVLPDGVYVLGGLKSGGLPSTNVYRFDGEQWTELPGLPQARSRSGGGALNGFVYAVGGNLSDAAETNTVFRYPAVLEDWGVGLEPAWGSTYGETLVAIVGANLGEGDVTNVTFGGGAAEILADQSPTQVLVRTGPGAAGPVDVRVCSVAYGATIRSNAYTYRKTAGTLRIFSDYGATLPPPGVYTNPLAVCLTNSVASPDTRWPTQFVCGGYSATGILPLAATATSVVFILTNDAAIHWRWTTNFWLEIGSAAHGGVSTGSEWRAQGEWVYLTAGPDPYWHFDRWFIAPDGYQTLNPLAFIMNTPKTVTPEFAMNLAAWQTPEWWLAGFGWTNDFDAAAANDADGDGAPTWQEYRADTNPTNRDSCLRLTFVGADRLIWCGGSGVVQYLEWAAEPRCADWSILATNRPPTGITNEWPTFEPGVYRIRAER